MNELAGRVAFVTGASGLIGRAVCRTLFTAGARLVEQYRSNLPALEGEGHRAVQADFAAPGWQANVAEALAAVGGAGILGLGAGSDAFFRLAGLAPPAPVPRTRNAILVIRALPLCLPPRHVLRVRDQIAAGAAAGRSVEDLDIAASLWTAVDDDREAALARAYAPPAGSDVLVYRLPA